MNAREFSEMDIHLALDGEMSAERLRSFNGWLEANPDMKNLAARFDADRQRLRTSLGAVAYEAVPGRLSAPLLSRGEAGLLQLRWWQGAAVATVAVLAAGAGYLAGRADPSPVVAEAPVPERALSAHRIYAAEKLHVVEVAASERDHLLGWLSRRVGTRLVAPDLGGQGLALVGGRLLPSGSSVAAQFMYEDAGGNRVSLYVTPAPGSPESGFRALESAGVNVQYWVDAGFGYALAGNAPASTIETASREAYAQIIAAGR